MRSWTPVTNVDQVEQKLRELCVKYNIKDVESEVRRMRKNYAQYKEVWEQKYIKESSPMNVMFTTMDDTTKGSAKMVPFRDLSIRKYLAAPNNAVVVQTNMGQTLTIWNAGSPNDIYYQVGELEDPGDAEGPDAIKRTIDMCFMRYIQET